MIEKLPEELVDRIAAGEVIERPASVVKELVENALDAGAGRVVVDIEAGGRRLIRVADDGDGIPSEELSLAFLRHATSKLRRIEDLYHIASLGFRGEALSSIGSVSRVRITSRPRRETSGACVENNGGETGPVKPAGCPNGTTVEVKELFYNVPARLKFMKTESTELSHCVDCLTRIALSRPEVGIELNHNGRSVLKADKNASILDRIKAFFGKDTAEKLIPLDREELGVHVHGYLGRPELGRRDTRRSLLFLNGRHIKDKTVHTAIRRAYKEVMPDKFHPFHVIELGMPPEWVDVNVHPTKVEVRFQDGARVFSAVFKTVADALAGGESFSASLPPSSSYRGWKREAHRPGLVSEPFTGTWRGSASTPGKQNKEAADSGAASFGREPAGGDLYSSDGAPSESDPRPASRDLRSPGSKVLNIHETYAVFETGDGLVIVDQHALHERILYERLKREYEKGGIRLQKLLVPVTLGLDAGLASIVSEICFDLNHLGIRAEPSGKDALKVTAVPALLGGADPKKLAESVLERISSGGRGEDEYLALLHRMACRAAVKAGDRLLADEIDALIDEAENVGYSGRCPHGRPTSVRITLKELETMFKRRGF